MRYKATGRLKQPLRPAQDNNIRQALLALRSNAAGMSPSNLAQRIKTGRHWWNVQPRRSGGAKFTRMTQIS